MSYLYIETKKTLKMLPRMLLQAALLIVLIGAAALGGAKNMEKDPLALSADIAVVVREDSVVTRMALGYIENMESVSRLCSFRQTTEEEGFRLLERGKVTALVLLPEQLVEGIMNGVNPTVDIYFPKNAGLEAMLFQEFAKSGEGMLRVAQAQIYGAGDTASAYGLTDLLSGIEVEIDSYNLAFALDRLALYEEETVTAFGAMNAIQYYLASGTVLFLLLAGMAMYPVLQREPCAFRKQLRRQGISEGWQCFCQWFCGVLYMGVIWGVWRAALMLIAKLMPSLMEGLTMAAAGRFVTGGAAVYSVGIRAGVAVLIVMTTTTFIFLLHSLAGGRTGGILLVFVCSVAMVYLAGGLVPSMFLPEVMRKAGEGLPAAYLIQAAGAVLTGSGITVRSECLWALCGYTLLFGTAAYYVRGRDRT